MTLQALQHPLDASASILQRPRTVGSPLHLDLSDAREWGAHVTDQLNSAFTQAQRAGRQFRVTPPESAGPRAAFLLAAARGDFTWASRAQ